MSLHRDAGYYYKEEAWKLETLGTLKIIHDDAINHGYNGLARIIEQGEDYLYTVIKYKEDIEV